MKAKYQDNLEMLQWIKRYYDLHSNGDSEYDAVGRRKGADLYLLGEPLKNLGTGAQKQPPSYNPPASVSSNSGGQKKPLSNITAKIQNPPVGGNNDGRIADLEERLRLSELKL